MRHVNGIGNLGCLAVDRAEPAAHPRVADHHEQSVLRVPGTEPPAGDVRRHQRPGHLPRGATTAEPLVIS
jgi:hypothetical protein